MVTLTTQALSVALDRRPVLHGIDATLSPGALIGVIGPNGAGKSTLARSMLGLTRPSAGRVTIDGDDVATLRPRDVARRIAYLPQGQQLHWPLSVERLVALGRLPHLGPLSRMTAADEAAIEEAMALADVLPLRQRIATHLSGGERARALLARALSVGAPALIADEPLASLDPGHQLQVMALLKQLASAGRLIVVVLHDLGIAARFCDRLLLLADGHLVADGPPNAVLTDDNLRQVYGVSAWSGEIDGQRLIIPLHRNT
jgi:iron complex transport system ATP-binding protein